MVQSYYCIEHAGGIVAVLRNSLAFNDFENAIVHDVRSCRSSVVVIEHSAALASLHSALSGQEIYMLESELERRLRLVSLERLSDLL